MFLPDLIGKRCNIRQAGGISYTGTFLGLGNHPKLTHYSVILRIGGQFYFVPLDWIEQVAYVGEVS